MGSKSKSTTVGFRYSFDLHFAIAKAIDGLLEIKASGKTAWKGNATSNQTIRINAPKLFGGDKGEGGIEGDLDLMLGAPDQPVNPKLQAMLGGLVPAFRGMATGFYSGLVTSINPYPKPWMLNRYRRMNGWDGAVWYPQTCAIDLEAGAVRAMNPAHILYETYTNREWGRGLDRSMLDDAAWRAAALKLYNEGFGLCLEWQRSTSLAQFRDLITDHIGAYVGPDRRTGLITLRLIRDDYNLNDLPLFDPDSGLLGIEDDEASSATAAPSQIVVEYTDAITGETRRARAVNAAMAAAHGGQSVEVINYQGLPTASLAGRVAARELRVRGGNLRRYKIRLDRRAWRLAPAEPFRVRDLKRGINSIVLRPGRIEDGTLVNGVITVTAVEDVFGLPDASFIPVPPSGYVPPNREPEVVNLRRLMELPYRELAGLVDAANIALIDPTAAWLTALAAKPGGLALSFNLLTRPGTSGAFSDRGLGDWCPTAQIAAGINREAGPTVVALSNAIDLDRVVVGQAALVGDEIVRVDAINLSTLSITLARGCADTVPAAHAAGVRIWFYDGFEAADEVEYSSGVNLQARLLTNTSTGQLAEALAATDTLALTGRQGRPYAPGNIKINGITYPTTVSGPVTISFSHRDRIMQADQLIDTKLGDVGPESGVQYRIRIYSGTSLKRTVTQTENTYLYTEANELADGGPFNPLRVVVDAVRGGIYSYQAHDITVARS